MKSLKNLSSVGLPYFLKEREPLLSLHKKSSKKRYSLRQRPFQIRLFPQHSPIIHLPVKYVHSLSLPECLFLFDWGYVVIFVFITELLSFFLPSSKACFSVLKNWDTCLWGESSALFHSHLFFFFGISEAFYAQKCFHSSWTIKSITTAVCFLNMNGNEWQQARQTFSFDLSLVMYIFVFCFIHACYSGNLTKLFPLLSAAADIQRWKASPLLSQRQKRKWEIGNHYQSSLFCSSFTTITIVNEKKKPTQERTPPASMSRCPTISRCNCFYCFCLISQQISIHSNVSGFCS